MSALFIVLPLALIFVIIALIVFVRAVRTGQFDDLDTPSIRVLHDESPPDEDAASDEADRPTSPPKRTD